MKRETTEYGETKPGVESTLVKFLINDENKNLVFKDPGCDENSLSEVAKRIAAASDTYCRIQDAWYNAENDPVSFRKNTVEPKKGSKTASDRRRSQCRFPGRYTCCPR